MEKISLAAMDANGVSSPSVFAIPCAIAVFPVPGATRDQHATSRRSFHRVIMFAITPAAFLARSCPTKPWDDFLASKRVVQSQSSHVRVRAHALDSA